jgi:salicylate hydroxylase
MSDDLHGRIHGKEGTRIAIVGGGIGGLSTALFLRRAGLGNVTVFEQAPELLEIGAGIQVAPNAVRLLRRLGLAERLAEVGVRLEVGWEFRRWEDGRVLFSQELGDTCERMFGEPYYTVHRAHLLDMLREAVPDEIVRLGHRCVDVTQRGGEVELTFENGSSERADAVIGADGIHSTVHDEILPPHPATFSGLCAYRCLIPAVQAPEEARRPVTTLWLGPGRHFVHYPVSAGQQINLVTANPAGDWRTESWTAEGRVEDLAAEFEGWDERVQQLIASANETKRYAFYDREPLERWTLGCVTLLGDAAHPMMPFFAQGATQAIEDAAVVAGCLREATPETVETALLRHEALRKERASKVQMLSRARREHHHLPDGEEQRKRDVEFAKEDPLGHNAWLYGHDVERDLQGPAEAPTGTAESSR